MKLKLPPSVMLAKSSGVRALRLRGPHRRCGGARARPCARALRRPERPRARNRPRPPHLRGEPGTAERGVGRLPRRTRPRGGGRRGDPRPREDGPISRQLTCLPGGRPVTVSVPRSTIYHSPSISGRRCCGAPSPACRARDWFGGRSSCPARAACWLPRCSAGGRTATPTPATARAATVGQSGTASRSAHRRPGFSPRAAHWARSPRAPGGFACAGPLRRR